MFGINAAFKAALLCVFTSMLICNQPGIAATMPRSSDESIFCRDSWYHNLSLPLYEQFTCAKCFLQVFMDEKALTINPSIDPLLLFDKDDFNISYSPDALEKDSQVCRHFLTKSECDNWKSCCTSAIECCHRHFPLSSDSDMCPGTWDGVACWDATSANTVATQRCPVYYELPELAWLSPEATRECDANGTWYIHPAYGLEKSNYSQCVDNSKTGYIIKISLYTGIVCKSVSIVFLLGAIISTICLKSIRQILMKNMEIKIHFNLFLSLYFMSAFWIVMDVIHIIKLDHPDQIDNQIWCRVIHGIFKYFLCTSYMCFFCEGLYLHRRFSHILSPIDDGLIKYYIISWVFPGVLAFTFVMCRIFLDNNGCWIDYKEHSPFDLLYMIPNSLTYICNLYFLIRILKNVCSSMRTDTHERKHRVLRQSVRALFYLVPIFGLQFLFLVYRPTWPPYEIIASFIIGIQGTIATILYFYTNREVKREFKKMISYKERYASNGSLHTPLRTDSLDVSRKHSFASTMATTVTHTNSIYKQKRSFKNVIAKISGGTRNDPARKISTGTMDIPDCELENIELFNQDFQIATNDLHVNRYSKSGRQLIASRLKHGSWNGMPASYTDRLTNGNPRTFHLKRSNSYNEETMSNDHYEIDSNSKSIQDTNEVNTNDDVHKKRQTSEHLTPIIEKKTQFS